jgi:SAM-dependent methyltransferase
MSGLGPSICLSNRSIRSMLRFAGASSKDVFFDLGCGAGQLCIIAVKEFGVQKAVGIDIHKGRAIKARERVKSLGLKGKIGIRNAYFEDVNLKPATIAYCGLIELPDSLEGFEQKLSPGCKLIMPNLPLMSVIPNGVDYPFYMMISPFKRTESVNRWASSVLMKDGTLEELVDELRKDLDWRTDFRSLRRLIRLRFGSPRLN